MKHLLPPLLLFATSVFADTLQPLGDEFEDPATFGQYLEHGAVEGWVSNIVEQADIHTTTPGHFRIVPRTCGWWRDARGLYFYKNITGDFIATTRLRVRSRHTPGQPDLPPQRLFSLSGLFLRNPRPITHAAPQPYTLLPRWPAANYGSDWTPPNAAVPFSGENYLFLSFGCGGNPGVRQFEIKTTRRSDSNLYYSDVGVPQGVASNEAWLQMVKVGTTAVCLRKHSAAGPWIIENRYSLNDPDAFRRIGDFGPAMQLGITAYTDWPTIDNVIAPYGYQSEGMYYLNYTMPNGQPDLVVDVDYLRLRRPPAGLTEAVLQGLPVSNTGGPNTNPVPVELAASPSAAPLLGDNASIAIGRLAVDLPARVAEGGAASVLLRRSGYNTNLVFSVDYELQAGSATPGQDFTAASGTLTWAPGDPPVKPLSIPVLADTLAEGPETLSLLLRNPNGPAAFYGNPTNLVVSVDLDDRPFDAWRFAIWGAQANGPDAQPSANPDGDMLPNLLEYAFNGSPTNLITQAHMSVAITNLVLSLDLNPAATDVDLAILTATHPGGPWGEAATRPAGVSTWSAQPGFVLPPPGAPNRLLLRRSNPDPVSTMRLYRLRATLPSS